MAQLEQINAQLDRLAAFEAGPFPVISLYLNLQPDQNGRDRFEPFLRKELGDRVRTYGAQAPELQSLEQDAEKIRAYVREVDPSANGVAIFACSAGDLFETVQLAAPVSEHRLYISDQAHVYPLARLLDEYPRYAALLADTNLARIFVFAVNAVERAERLEGVKTRRHKMGGWSQARYQRHVDNFHRHHAKEVTDTLLRIVQDESIESIVVAGDEVIVPLLKEQFPKEITERLIDIVTLDIRANDREVLEATIATLRERDVVTDRERVDELLGAYRAGGLGVVGVEATRLALEMGQVDELVIAATPDTIDTGAATAAGDGHERTPEERVADELVLAARQSAASVRFIQDASLVAAIGGVGAFLRFKI